MHILLEELDVVFDHNINSKLMGYLLSRANSRLIAFTFINVGYQSLSDRLNRDLPVIQWQNLTSHLAC